MIPKLCCSPVGSEQLGAHPILGELASWLAFSSAWHSFSNFYLQGRKPQNLSVLFLWSGGEVQYRDLKASSLANWLADGWMDPSCWLVGMGKSHETPQFHLLCSRATGCRTEEFKGFLSCKLIHWWVVPILLIGLRGKKSWNSSVLPLCSRMGRSQTEKN